MTISEYKVKRDFRAPKVNINDGEMQSYFSFQKGQNTTGYVDDSTGAKLLITENAYALPLSILTFLRDIEIDGEPVDYVEDEEKKEQALEKEKSPLDKDGKEKISVPKEYRERMDKIKNTNVVNSIISKSRNSVNGLIIGGIAGLVLALMTRQSKFGGIVIGGIIGGAVGYGIAGDGKEKPKKTDTKDKDKTDSKKPDDGKKD